MLVVSDTSPLVLLAKLRHIDLLPALFDSFVIADIFARIKQTDFWIPHRPLDRRLDEYLRNNPAADA